MAISIGFGLSMNAYRRIASQLPSFMVSAVDGRKKLVALVGQEISLVGAIGTNQSLDVEFSVNGEVLATSTPFTVPVGLEGQTIQIHGTDTFGFPFSLEVKVISNSAEEVLSPDFETVVGVGVVSAVGPYGWTLDVSPNKGGGTIYYAAFPYGSPVPSLHSIVTGSGAISFGSYFVENSGDQTIVGDGVTSDTEAFVAFVHADAYEVYSDVYVSGMFKTEYAPINLFEAGNFSDPDLWETPNGIYIADGKLVFDGTNSGGAVTNMPDGAACPVTPGILYDINIEVSRADSSGKRVRMQLDYLETDEKLSNNLGSYRMPDGKSTSVPEVGVVADQFTPPEGTNFVRVKLYGIDAGVDADFESIKIVRAE